MPVAADHDPVPSSSRVDGDGVRRVAIDDGGQARSRTRRAVALIVIALIAGIGLWWTSAAPTHSKKESAPIAQVIDGTNAPRPVIAAQRAMPEKRDASAQDDDLAAYFQPGDQEPTGAELIAALHDLGIRDGIAAFNPPGTSPPLEGIAVPEDAVLPAGYVRHHQVTDDGVSIEPILMFSPDHRFYDASGREIAIPDNRVVPPEWVPPGIPLRRVRIPPGP